MTAVGCSKKDTLPSVSGDVYSLAFTDSLTHWTNSTYFRSDEMIDLSRINTLYIKFKSLTTSDYGKIAVSLTTNAYSGKQTDVSDTKLVALGNAAIASVNVRPNDNVWAVDLSSYNTLMYIYIGAYSGFDTMPGSSYSNTRNGSVACEIEEVYY